MDRQVVVSIPDDVYQQAEQAAQAARREVSDVIAEVVVEAFPPLHVDGERAAMQREKAAFQAMHDTLLARYEGEYVAVHGGEVVDHDSDQLALVKRRLAKFGDETVLIERVSAEPERVLHFRSPRLVRS